MNYPRFASGLNAQFPQFGRPNWGRFRPLMDNLGGSYAQDFFVYTVDFGAVNAAASAIQTINIEQNSAFDLVAIAGGGLASANVGPWGALANVNLTITDSASARNLFNHAIPLANIVGSGDFPFVLPITRRFSAGTQITLAVNNTGAGNLTQVELTFIGRKIFLDALPGGRQGPPPRFNAWQDQQTGRCYTEDFFAYDWTLATLAATTKTPVTQLIEADSDFEWIATTASGTTDNAGAGNAPISVQNLPIKMQVRDQTAGRELFSQETLVGNIAGGISSTVGLTPFILPQPRIFMAKSSVTVTFNNLSNVQYDLIHFTMIGRKIFEQD